MTLVRALLCVAVFLPACGQAPKLMAPLSAPTLLAASAPVMEAASAREIVRQALNRYVNRKYPGMVIEPDFKLDRKLTDGGQRFEAFGHSQRSLRRFNGHYDPVTRLAVVTGDKKLQ